MHTPDPNNTGGNGSYPPDMDEPLDPAAHHVPTRYAPKTGRYLAIGAGALGLALAAAFLVVHHVRGRHSNQLADEAATALKTPPVVDVVSVKPSPTRQPLALPGETRAWYQSTLYARVSGYIGKWAVDMGDKVKKGQTLAEIETPELDAQLRAAQAKLHAAEAQVTVEDANSQFASTTYQRWKESPKGVVSDQEREAKKADYDSSVARLQAARAQVALNRADVESLQALTQFKQVSAPYDGVIISRHIDIGDLVTAGSTNSNSPLYSLAQSDTIRVFVDVPQSASTDMRVGMPAEITTGVDPARRFDGKITRTADAIDPVSRTLHVEADVPNPDLTLVPGMYVQANFELVKKALLEVPASALLFRSSGQRVAVVDKNGQVHFRKITIALDEGDYVEVGSGLEAGDLVALNVSSEIDDGETVAINEVDKAPSISPPVAPAAPPAKAAAAPPAKAAAVSSVDTGR